MTDNTTRGGGGRVRTAVGWTGRTRFIDAFDERDIRSADGLPQALLDRCRALGVIAIVWLLAGCSDLTRVTNDSATTTQQLNNPAGAVIRRNGALSAFYTDYSSQVEYSGLITDELTTSGGNVQLVDQRVINPANAVEVNAPYINLSAARLNGLYAIQSLKTYAPGSPARIGELYALVGYVETMFAEDMCSGVPLGTVTANGTAVLGPALTTTQLLAAAIAHFDSAAQFDMDSGGAADSAVPYLAAVGLGRTLLDSGDFTAAASAVAGVPLSFVYSAAYNASVGPQNNVAETYQALAITVSDFEGGNGLGFVSAADPRLVLDSSSSSPIYGRDVYFPASQSNPAAPIVLASGVEARLIVAEGLLRSGNVAAWADSLNSLRALAPPGGIPPLPADSTTAASAALQLAVHFRERAFWLFGTAQRQSDLRRLVRQYGLNVNAVFPSGPYAGGGVYGSDVTFVPYNEQGNPNFTACFNRDP
jgi:starch-binding outer membrane protein, SusD/RagB family